MIPATRRAQAQPSFSASMGVKSGANSPPTLPMVLSNAPVVPPQRRPKSTPVTQNGASQTPNSPIERQRQVRIPNSPFSSTARIANSALVVMPTNGTIIRPSVPPQIRRA